MHYKLYMPQNRFAPEFTEVYPQSQSAIKTLVNNIARLSEAKLTEQIKANESVKISVEYTIKYWEDGSPSIEVHAQLQDLRTWQEGDRILVAQITVLEEVESL